MPASPVVEQLRTAWARQPNDVFDIRQAGGNGAHGGRITRPAPCGYKAHDKQAAADLEAPVVDVLMRNAITGEMRR
jgi:hypothetical protein